MTVARFIWLADIVRKLASEHGVVKEEVVELFQNQPRFRFVEAGHREGENVYSAMGRLMPEDTWLASLSTRKTIAR